MPDKTNEITGFARLLAPFGLTGIVVTADALHTQREHVRFLTRDQRDQQAHYLLVVKNNQPSLSTALRPLPGAGSPPAMRPAAAGMVGVNGGSSRR
ncbi:hypothetical protein [Streptomyces sp. NPDC021096]|uniref:hypothetical protein n=1 Tax=Streptomyces sp. NPDC021096 TaxID=3154792 RepID=UPI0033E20703